MEELPTNTATSTPRIGSYRLTKPLGSGGMSSVFRAEHVETGLEVAVKILPRSLARNPTLLQRFIREAKSAESLEHPSIVAIYDRGFDDGRHYLVLELVSGGDLHDFIRNHGKMSPKEATRVIRAAVDGLRYAAAQGVIHRDVKPANLLLTKEGKVKVTDLGLALQLEDEDERVTRDGTTVGTVDYMAPEQARDSRATSIRSDIYSLGCTFYYLLTGQPPFHGGDVLDKLRRHATEPPPDIRKLRPEVSQQLGLLIRRMMSKTPENRPIDYSELIANLDALPESHFEEPDGLPALVPLDDETSGLDFEIGPARPSGETRRKPDSTIESPRFAPATRQTERPDRSFGPASSRTAADLEPIELADSRLLRQMLIPEAAEPGLPPQMFDSSGVYRNQSPGLVSYMIRGALVGLAIAALFFGVRALVANLNAPPSAATHKNSPSQSSPETDRNPSTLGAN